MPRYTYNSFVLTSKDVTLEYSGFGAITVTACKRKAVTFTALCWSSSTKQDSVDFVASDFCVSARIQQTKIEKFVRS